MQNFFHKVIFEVKFKDNYFVVIQFLMSITNATINKKIKFDP
jgi:hypothetical protein